MKYKFSSSKKNRFNFINGNDLNSNNIINGVHIEMFSNKKIIVEDCKNIVDYQEDYIKLKLKDCYLNIFGKNFLILFFEKQMIEINGNIVSIEFN